MDIKETLEKLAKFAEDNEQNPDIKLRAAKLRNKAEEMGLKCTSLSSGFDNSPMIMLNIYIGGEKPLNVFIYNDKPTKFEYNGFSGYQDDVIKLEKMVEIAKAL